MFSALRGKKAWSVGRTGTATSSVRMKSSSVACGLPSEPQSQFTPFNPMSAGKAMSLDMTPDVTDVWEVERVRLQALVHRLEGRVTELEANGTAVQCTDGMPGRSPRVAFTILKPKIIIF